MLRMRWRHSYHTGDYECDSPGGRTGCRISTGLRVRRHRGSPSGGSSRFAIGCGHGSTAHRDGSRRRRCASNGAAPGASERPGSRAGHPPRATRCACAGGCRECGAASCARTHVGTGRTTRATPSSAAQRRGRSAAGSPSKRGHRAPHQRSSAPGRHSVARRTIDRSAISPGSTSGRGVCIEPSAGPAFGTAYRSHHAGRRTPDARLVADRAYFGSDSSAGPRGTARGRSPGAWAWPGTNVPAASRSRRPTTRTQASRWATWGCSWYAARDSCPAAPLTWRAGGTSDPSRGTCGRGGWRTAASIVRPSRLATPSSRRAA